ncbi:MAG TPA: hypothetical protein VGL57_10555 [Solirubrobacteraceae bacterium]|jgi:hypothetical protein
MSANHLKRTLTRAILAAAILATSAAVLMHAGVAQAATPPVKLVLSGHITNGFEYPEGVAVNDDAKSPAEGNVYVTDKGHHRVQEFTAAGMFVAMFGWEVNKTKVQAHATQAERNICTAASGDTCQVGVSGLGAEAFNAIFSVTVDPNTGNVYVQDRENWRVDEYTAEGQFVLMIGGEVNETKDKTAGASEAEKNVCTAESKDTCEAGVQGAESAAHGVFDFASGSAYVLAAGGPEDLLYVGDEHRVQEFHADGAWAGEISLTSISAEPEYFVRALALDQETGDLYLEYSNEAGSDTIHEFDLAGGEAASFAVAPRQAGNQIQVRGLGVDSAGHLAAITIETSYASGRLENLEVGVLYDAVTGHRITTFTVPSQAGLDGMAFSSGGSLYVTAAVAQEVLSYTPDLVAELLARPAGCTPGMASGSLVAFDCELEGEVNPEGVAGTEAFFEWGPTEALGETTAKQTIATGALPVPVQGTISGVRPNETLHYELAGYDEPVQAPEELTSERTSVKTPAVAPRVVGAPSASFVTSSSVVLSGALNPENANTTYEFLYAPACASGEEVCPAIAQAPGVQRTAVQESGIYGNTGATLEATGLQPATTYRFALMAENAAGGAVSETGGAALPEGTFTTAPAPVPTAVTGAASAVGATSATISGSVDPDGLAATYSFEVGVYEGTATQYGVVFSGPAGAGTAQVQEAYALSGLQPGATYAFRVTVHSGYIHNGENAEHGAPALFTTAGVPSVLSAPPVFGLVATPTIAFPKAVSRKTSKKGNKAKKKKKKTHKTKAKGKRSQGAQVRRGRAKKG